MARPQAWRSQTAGPLTGRALRSNVPRGWRKIPLGIDEETREVRAVEITGSHIGDAPVLPDLLNQIPAHEQIGSVTADGAAAGAYDGAYDPGLRPFRAELIHWINSGTPFTPQMPRCHL